MSDTAERSSRARNIAAIAICLAVSAVFGVVIWFVILRYEDNPVFEGLVVLSSVGSTAYMVFILVRMLVLQFRGRR